MLMARDVGGIFSRAGTNSGFSRGNNGFFPGVAENGEISFQPKLRKQPFC